MIWQKCNIKRLLSKLRLLCGSHVSLRLWLCVIMFFVRFLVSMVLEGIACTSWQHVELLILIGNMSSLISIIYVSNSQETWHFTCLLFYFWFKFKLKWSRFRGDIIRVNLIVSLFDFHGRLFLILCKIILRIQLSSEDFFLWLFCFFLITSNHILVVQSNLSNWTFYARSPGNILSMQMIQSLKR